MRVWLLFLMRKREYFPSYLHHCYYGYSHDGDGEMWGRNDDERCDEDSPGKVF